MFFDHKIIKKIVENEKWDDLQEPEEEWKRIERKIYSGRWRAVHNLIAHPLLAIYRPLGEKLHEYTAERMYRPNGEKPIITDND